jgi:hypothetical protein
MAKRRRNTGEEEDQSEVMILVIEYYDGHAVPRRGWQSIRCISPDHPDSHSSASVNLALGAYKCFSCELSAGSPAGLIGKIDGIGKAGAWERLQEICGRSNAAIPRKPGKPRRTARSSTIEESWAISGNSGLF